MQKVKILFFAADPLSISAGFPRLELDKDVRQIREKVRASEHRDALDFDVRWAVRTDDLLQALNEARPQVVHFSGHGNAQGLVLVSAEGMHPHTVETSALVQLFSVFRGDIRLVVLNACFSLPQAEAIASVIGCAIGTRNPISDEAAITFGASFYRAIAFGHSVQASFDQARAALALEHFEERECPELVVGPGVDPVRLVLVTAEDTDGEGDVPAASYHRGDEFWRTLASVMIRLYPGGPQEDRVWQRAGGDASRLPSGVNGRTAWYDAVSLIRHGGGGATVKSLLREVKADYPGDPDVIRLMG